MMADSLPQIMRSVADDFVAELGTRPGCRKLDPPMTPPNTGDLVWHNTLFESPDFRRAHVELFEIPEHFVVVHVCVLPHVWSISPIFGFDMIGGRAQATGVFLDFSPVTGAAPRPALGEVVGNDIRTGFRSPRTRPEWGCIFSDDFFAIRPSDPLELRTALGVARRALTFFLHSIAGDSGAAGSVVPDPRVLQGQAAYANAQRQNPHTLRMLARYVGLAAARRFIDDVLFPYPN